MPAPDGRPRLLILGGTGEARALAAALAEAGDIDFVTALAGRTSAVAGLPGHVRRGGFGGATGLAAYLAAEAIDLVVDATHPFATQISAHAVVACEQSGVERLVLDRPAWRPTAGDRWTEVATLAEAASLLPRYGRRVFLTIGRQGLAAFATGDDLWFLARVAEPPDAPLPLGDCRVIAARGPFDVAAERRLLEENAIDVLVCKASGGTATDGKLIAARALDLPVIMIRRPPPPPGPRVTGVGAALDAVRTMLDALPCREETPVS